MENETTKEQVENQLALANAVNKALQAEIGQLVSTVAELRVILEAVQQQEAAAAEVPSED